MKWLLAFAMGLFFSQTGVAQGIVNQPPIYLRDVFRQPFQTQKHAGITGSPFIFDNWMLASIMMADDRVADSVYIRLNAYENKVHFKDENGEEMQAIIAIKQITITDNNPTWHGVVFRSGYKGGGNAFFQVLQDGKNMQLVKKWMVNKWETKALGEEEKRSFQLEDEIYFAGYGNVYRQNKKCSMLSEAFEKKQEEILRFAATNDIKCNKEEDMRKLVRYFNSL
ncbi:MAG: hypothetical protein ABIT05_01555 [Chitinophagaceae bacterium]